MPLPSTLGRFRLRRELGRGGMGAVWLAEDPTLEREVALKLLPPEVAGDAARLARFRREARLLAAVSHPNIAVAYGLEELEGQQVLVMEYVPGETLADLLDRGPLPPADALGLAAQVAAGLGAAHDAGLVHRDLKPANVIVGEDGRVRVLDFGLARAERGRSDSDTFSGDLLTREGLVMGTPRYMSPEQARGQPLDARTDVWSFGIVLFELLTGAHPFAADTEADALVALLSKPVAWERLPSGLPGSVRPLLEACLDRDPQARPARLGEVGRGLERARRQLDQVAARRGVGAAPGPGATGAPDSQASTSPGTPPTLTPTAPEPAPLAPGRGRIVLAAAAALLLGGGLGGGLVAGLRGGGDPAPAAAPPTWQRLGEGRGLVTGARFTADHTRVVASGDGAGPVGAGGAALWLLHPSEGATPVPGPAEARLLAAVGAELLVLDTPRRWFSGARGTLARLPAGGGAARAVREEVVDADAWRDGVGLLTVARTLEAPAGTEWDRDIEAAVRLRMASDGSAALVLNQSGQLSLHRPDGSRTLLVERGATSMAWAPDGGTAWVGLPEGGGTALRPVALDGTLGAPFARHPGELVLLDVAPDGRMLVDLRRSRASSLVRAPAPGGVTDTRDVGLGGECVALSDDGAVALVDVAARAGEVGAGWLRPLPTADRPAPPAPVRLESGQVTDLAPDGSAILLVPEPGVSDHVLVVPTGAGTPRRVDLSAIAPVWTGWLAPDGAVLVVGTRPGGGVQLHFAEPGQPPRPVAEPGWGVPALARPWAPDGRHFFATGAGGVRVWSLDGDPPRDVPGVEPGRGEMPAGYAADGAIFVYDRDHVPAVVWRVDPATGVRSAVFELDVPDRAGVTGVTGLRVTPDGRVACWGVTQTLSELYLSAAGTP